MFILRAILIACAVILLFCFKVLFFGKKKSVSRPKPSSYPDQTKAEKAGGGVKQNPQFEEKQEKLFSYLDSLKAEKQEENPSFDLPKTEERKEEKEKPCSNLLKPEKRKEEEKKQKEEETKPSSDLSKTEEREKEQKEQKEEKKEEETKPSSDLSKTIPRSYSTTLPGFERIQQRKPSSYSDLLNTEEWRNKRLKIIKRDNCRCVYCGNRFHLHVHHKYYSAYPNGALVDPWNYPDDALITLCSYCHQRVHARKKIKVYHRRYTDNY